jgi:hypothetical protein
LRLDLETRERRGVVYEDVGHEFDRDSTLKGNVIGSPDAPHPALGDLVPKSDRVCDHRSGSRDHDSSIANG